MNFFLWVYQMCNFELLAFLLPFINHRVYIILKILVPEFAKYSELYTNREDYLWAYELRHLNTSYKNFLANNSVCLGNSSNGGGDLEKVKNQTEDILSWFVKLRYENFKLVKKQTYKLCFETIKRRPTYLCYVNPNFQTNELCLKAVENNWRAIISISKELQTPEMCRIAIEQDKDALMFCAYKIEEILLDAARPEISPQTKLTN